jgi:hypothetical protein
MHPRRAFGGLVLFLLAALCAVLFTRGPARHLVSGERVPADTSFQSPGPDADTPGSAIDETDSAAPFVVAPPAPVVGVAGDSRAPRIRRHSPENSPSRAPPTAV